MNIKTLKQFIQNIINKKNGLGFELNDGTELIESNLLESIDLLAVIIFLQEEFKIEFEFTDYDKANFRSLNEIEKFIRRKEK